MADNSIGKFMETTMQKIREMIDVNTVVGSPIETSDGITLIPVSRVTFGFAGGGADINTKSNKPSGESPVGCGTGAGVNITPVAFLVIKDGNVRIMNIAAPVHTTADRIVDMAPDLIDKVGSMINHKKKDE